LEQSTHGWAHLVWAVRDDIAGFGLGFDYVCDLARLRTVGRRRADTAGEPERNHDDDSADADPAAGRAPEPVLVLHMQRGKILNAADLPNTPDWARPLVAAALKLNIG
jgi:hypothetical protein